MTTPAEPVRWMTPTTRVAALAIKAGAPAFVIVAALTELAASPAMIHPHAELPTAPALSVGVFRVARDLRGDLRRSSLHQNALEIASGQMAKGADPNLPKGRA